MACVPTNKSLPLIGLNIRALPPYIPPPPHPTPITPKSRAKKGLRYQVVLQSSEGIGLIKCFIILEKFKTRTVYISYSELIVYDGE